MHRAHCTHRYHHHHHPFPQTFFLEIDKNIYSREKRYQVHLHVFFLYQFKSVDKKNPFRNPRHEQYKKHTRQAGTGNFLERKSEKVEMG